MLVNITENEYEALLDACSELSKDCEGTTDERYLNPINNNISMIGSICEKYRTACSKNNLLKQVKKAIREKEPGLPERLVSKYARKAIKENRS